MIRYLLLKIAQWVVFLGCSAAVLLAPHFYLTHPGSLTQFDAIGIRRILLLGGAFFGVVVLGKAILRDFARAPDSLPRQQDEPFVAAYWAANTIHPLLATYRRYPVLTVVLLLFLVSLPPLFALISGEREAWLDALIGEILIGLAIAVAWYRLRRPTS